MKQVNRDALDRLRDHARTSYKRGFEAGYARCKLEMEMASAERDLRAATEKLNSEADKLNELKVG